MIVVENEVRLAGKIYSLSGPVFEINKKVSDFEVLDINLSKKTLNNFLDKIKLISVFLSVDTGVCSSQNISFNKIAGGFPDKVVTLSISADLPFALRRFAETKCLDHIIMLSDHRDLDFGKKSGLVIEQLRLLTRAVLVIDQKNILRYIEIVGEMTDHPDYKKVTEFVWSLIR